jgi:hypothetical protein
MVVVTSLKSSRWIFVYTVKLPDGYDSLSSSRGSGAVRASFYIKIRSIRSFFSSRPTVFHSRCNAGYALQHQVESAYTHKSAHYEVNRNGRSLFVDSKNMIRPAAHYRPNVIYEFFESADINLNGMRPLKICLSSSTGSLVMASGRLLLITSNAWQGFNRRQIHWQEK